MADKRIGLIGATSLVGECLLPLLTNAGWQVTAFSRLPVGRSEVGVAWRQLESCPSLPEGEEAIPYWICAAPIWVLPDYFDFLKTLGARRVVALSSTSRFVKEDSTDREEQAIARRLAGGEDRLQGWAKENGIEWGILRPTLIYGKGRDRNISEIARFIRRFGFFPLLGQAQGLRQPVHATDVAEACLGALSAPAAGNRAYNISGGETLAYSDMVKCVFSGLGRHPHFLRVPLFAFRLAVACLRCIPRYRSWSTAMVERMNCDLIFDHAEAGCDLDFSPRPFGLAEEDLPR